MPATTGKCRCAGMNRWRSMPDLSAVQRRQSNPGVTNRIVGRTTVGGASSASRSAVWGYIVKAVGRDRRGIIGALAGILLGLIGGLVAGAAASIAGKR